MVEDKELHMRMLRPMMLVRRFHETLKELVGRGELVGAAHRYIGAAEMETKESSPAAAKVPVVSMAPVRSSATIPRICELKAEWTPVRRHRTGLEAPPVYRCGHALGNRA